MSLSKLIKKHKTSLSPNVTFDPTKEFERVVKPTLVTQPVTQKRLGGVQEETSPVSKKYTLSKQLEQYKAQSNLRNRLESEKEQLQTEQQLPKG